MGRKFVLSISGEAELDIEQIWPDGDAPESPTAADVLAVLRKDGGAFSPVERIIGEWSLEDCFSWEVL